MFQNRSSIHRTPQTAPTVAAANRNCRDECISPDFTPYGINLKFSHLYSLYPSLMFLIPVKPIGQHMGGSTCVPHKPKKIPDKSMSRHSQIPSLWWFRTSWTETSPDAPYERDGTQPICPDGRGGRRRNTILLHIPRRDCRPRRATASDAVAEAVTAERGKYLFFAEAVHECKGVRNYRLVYQSARPYSTERL